jgi:hypothetical protein
MRGYTYKPDYDVHQLIYKLSFLNAIGIHLSKLVTIFVYPSVNANESHSQFSGIMLRPPITPHFSVGTPAILRSYEEHLMPRGAL